VLDSDKHLRVWAFYPPVPPLPATAGAPRKGFQIAQLSHKGTPRVIGRIRKAVLQNVPVPTGPGQGPFVVTPYLYFVGCVVPVGSYKTSPCSKVSLGRVLIQSFGLGANVGVTLDDMKLVDVKTDTTGGSNVQVYNPTFDVLPNGSVIVTYGRYLDQQQLNVGVVYFDPTLKEIPPTLNASKFSDTVIGAVAGTPGPLPRFDYTGSSNDPLYAWQVWFAHPASTAFGYGFKLGANALGLY
jgi:hypothetical protein